jgi:hypothetical protein
MNDDEQQAAEYRAGHALGRRTAEQDQRSGRYPTADGATRYREVNGIPRGLDLHADFASARAGFIAGYRSLSGEE